MENETLPTSRGVMAFLSDFLADSAHSCCFAKLLTCSSLAESLYTGGQDFVSTAEVVAFISKMT